MISMETWPFTKTIQSAHPGAEIFVVGGAVRDWLLGKPVKDYDLVVRGVPIDDLIATLREAGEVDAVGKRFGVLKFRPSGDSRTFDIALPRKEYSWAFSGGYRDFDIQSDHALPIDVDLSRRDFTVNAMACNVVTQEIIDPFFGQKDLKAKIIRTVGSAATRFQEDYSRMLRAVRFACRLDFTLSEQTAKAIRALGHHLNDRMHDNWVVAREVLSQEFLKAFDANPVRCLSLLDELGLLDVILPEVKLLQHCPQTPPYHTEGNAYEHVVLALRTTETEAFRRHFPEPIPLLSKLAILFHDLGKPAAAKKDGERIRFIGHESIGAKITSEICTRLKLGSTPFYPFHHDDLVWLVREHLFAIKRKGQSIKATTIEQAFFSPRRPGRSLLHCMLADQLASVRATPAAEPEPIETLLEQIRALAPDGTLPPPLISGHDVIEWLDIKEGPRVAELRDAVREEQLHGRLKSKADAKTFLVSKYGKR